MHCCLGLALVLLASAAVPAAELRTDFEHRISQWIEPGGRSRVVVEPGNPQNHAYRIVADKPHHTRLVLKQSEAAPDFVASLRLKILGFEGAPPAVYVYGRMVDGFRALVVRPESVEGMAYFGSAKPSVGLGKVNVQTQRKWVHVKLVCYGDWLAGKAWVEGTAEPFWQIEGETGGQARGRFAVGVWTSPHMPSKAEVLVDDITFRSITQADLVGLRLVLDPRPPLAAEGLPANGAFESPAFVGLATPLTIMAFDRQSGGLAHVVDRSTRQEFVAPHSRLPLFTISLTRPGDANATAVQAVEFARVRSAKAQAGRIELEFSGHPTLNLAARVTAAVGDDGLVHLRIGVTNRSDLAVNRIEFPRFTAPAKLGREASDDRLLWPTTDGTVFESPGRLTFARQISYPGYACVQLTAYYDAIAGLYLAAHDGDGHCKTFGVRSIKDRGLELPMAHLLPEIPGQDVELPYDVVLGTFHGDWRDAADLYKRWARQQPWCKTPLAQRHDIAPFLKEGSGFIIVGIQNVQGYSGNLGPNLEKLPDLAAAYRRRTGLAHIVIVPYGWENHGMWAGINYFPAVPSDNAWRKANAALRAQGDRAAMLTSGFWWVVKRQRTGNGPAFDDSADFQRRQAMVVHAANGKPWYIDAYHQTATSGDWRGLTAELCHGSPAARQAMRGIFLEVARLGTPLVSFDQEIGGCQKESCYSHDHGHPPGYGNWMWTDFRDLCARILREGKPIQPELGLFMEDCSELAIPYMATYWSRQFGEVDHGGPGGRGVALFSYLYHEYVTAIGAACVQGQGQLGTRPSAELRCHVLANNLTRGLIPGPFATDVPVEPADDWHQRVSAAFFAFSQAYARFPEYLILGQTRRPPPIDCAEVEAGFDHNDPAGTSLAAGGPKVDKATVRLPVVTAGRFEARDSSQGIVVVNSTPRPQTVAVTLGPGSGSGVLYRADRSVQQRYPSLPPKLQIELEPLGTRMLVTDPAGKGG